MQVPGRLRDRDYLCAGFALVIVLNIFFFPVIWGNKSLMLGIRHTASIMPGGAYGDIPPVKGRTPDSGAPAWCAEPWFKIISDQLLKERGVPLWNPYSAYGAPLAANMQSQPFYPPSFLLSLHYTPYTYDLYLIFRLFVAGMFCYLFLRLFVDAVSAFAGSIILMFSGYYLTFLNMPHLSVEVMLPAVFYFFELQLRKGGIKSILASSAVIFCAVTGGMPESTFLVLNFGYMYFIFRLLTDASLKEVKWDRAKGFVIANMLGFSLSAFLLFPFLEFLRNSFNIHQNEAIFGLLHVGITEYRNTLLYLVPHALGSGKAVYYLGLAPFVFALTAVAAYFRPPWKQKTTVIGTLVVFFAISVVLMIMKHFGMAPVNWIGYLPLSRFILYYKYQEPLLSFAIAVLAAIGFSTLKMNIEARYFRTAIFLTACIVATLFWGPQKQMLQALHAALVLIVVAYILVCLYGRNSKNKYIVIAIFSVLLIEIILNFAPGFYRKSSLPNRSNDPYQGAPYISFLKNVDRDYSRVFAVEGVLYPNWAGVFGLFDVRSVDAMYYSGYRSFIRNFLLDGKPDDSDDFSDRFTGAEGRRYTFSALAEKRFLQLSSIRYIVSKSSDPDMEFAGGNMPFRRIYDKEVFIHEFPDVLPRASVFYGAEIIDDGDKALSRLKDRSFDVFEKVIVDCSQCGESEKSLVRTLSQAPPQKMGPARIVSYESQEVVVSADLKQPGILMLNDSNYPGWRAFVDGKEAKILKSDYLFRGVVLGTGPHIVTFKYRPKSFLYGLFISAAAFTVVCIAILKARINKGRENPIENKEIGDA